MAAQRIVGLDIGGANLKAALADGQAVAIPFPLWRVPEELPSALAALLERLPPADALAVTMTGELADCFTTKAEGVRIICQAALRVAGNRPVGFWHTAGQFVKGREASADPLGVAAANWHGLATWGGRFAAAGPALLIDIGSTTTDLIPLREGSPCAAARTDMGRLQTGELVYSGVWRTPLCAVTRQVPWRGGVCAWAAELFATMLDVYLLLGEIPEAGKNRETADNRPATREAAHSRLAHMLCGDVTEISFEECRELARFVATAQRCQLREALSQVLARLCGEWEPLATVIVSGSGSFLARQLVAEHPRLNSARLRSLDAELGAGAAEAACAYALAVLGTERGLGRED